MIWLDFDMETYGEVKKEEGYEEGYEEGFKLGLEEVRKEERITNIKSCFANGLSIKKIAEIYEMTEDEIKEIVE